MGLCGPTGVASDAEPLLTKYLREYTPSPNLFGVIPPPLASSRVRDPNSNTSPMPRPLPPPPLASPAPKVAITEADYALQASLMAHLDDPEVDMMLRWWTEEACAKYPAGGWYKVTDGELAVYFSTRHPELNAAYARRDAAYRAVVNLPNVLRNIAGITCIGDGENGHRWLIIHPPIIDASPDSTDELSTPVSQSPPKAPLGITFDDIKDQPVETLIATLADDLAYDEDDEDEEDEYYSTIDTTEYDYDDISDGWQDDVQFDVRELEDSGVE